MMSSRLVAMSLWLVLRRSAASSRMSCANRGEKGRHTIMVMWRTTMCVRASLRGHASADFQQTSERLREQESEILTIGGRSMKTEKKL